MSSPSSCTRCSRLQDLLTPRGLCPECAATDATANPTSVAPLPVFANSFAPTVTNVPPPGYGSLTISAAPAAETVSAPPTSGSSFPDSPAGYEILGPLGHGGMGDVYLAREQPSGRRVAIKFLQRPKNPNEFNRFVSELQILANLDHPHIVRVFTSDFLRDTPFFTMEYMQGGSLAAALKPKPGTSEPNLPPVPDALRLIRQVAGACAAAHAKGVIHRDLKPGNILLAPDGTPRLADFGLARQLDRDTAFTRSGGLGTPGYMPPEQVTAKNGEVGKWSDIYGLGAVLYHLLTGCPPFKEDTAEKTIVRMLADPPVRPRAIKPELPLGLEAIVLKCLERDPKDRYQTVAEFLADLDKYEAGQTPAAPPMTRARRAKRWVGRNRQRIGVAVAVAAATVLGVTGWVLALPSGQPATTPRPAQVIPDEIRTPDGRLLPFRVRLGHDKSKVTVADDGTITVSSWGLCLVEYTPGPGSATYQFHASVRHEESDLTGEVGIYFAHRALPGRFGERRLFGRCSYNDLRSPADKALAAAQPLPIPAPPSPENRPRISFVSFLPGSDAAWTGKDWCVAGQPFRVCGSVGNCWRDLEVVVGPGGVSGTWAKQLIGSVPAERITAGFAEELARARRLAADKDPPHPDAGRYDPAGSIGLFVEQSVASFREVRVDPTGARD